MRAGELRLHGALVVDDEHAVSGRARIAAGAAVEVCRDHRYVDSGDAAPELVASLTGAAVGGMK